MDEMNEHGVQVKVLSLIDVCSEDDSLISQSADNLQDHQLFEFPDAVDAGKVEDTSQQGGQLSQLSESLEQGRAQKIGKCNLRKSLAWDSAFFTSAGVLEPEELTSIIEGVDSRAKHPLPQIQEEDLHRSTDSISTMESDRLTFESLEADLFEDVRASIQKSRIRSNVINLKNSKAGTGEMKGSKKVDVASQSKRQPKMTYGMKGSGQMIKQGSVHPGGAKLPSSSRESTSSLPKPPKIISGGNPISIASTKRASLGVNSPRMEKDNARSSTGIGASGLKMTGLGQLHGFVPRPTQSSKLSSKCLLPAVKTEPTTSSSSVDSSANAPSDNIGKYSTNIMRRKFDSRTSNPTCGSTLKTRTKTPARNKILSANSQLSAYLMSTAKLYSSTSPASSISEWSTESSSSTCIVNQRSCNSTASQGTSSPSKVVCEAAFPTVGPENRITESLSQIAKTNTKGPGPLHPLTSAKPSGLRMPSPKIGFFDGVKSMVRSPSGSMQTHSGIPSCLPTVPGLGSPKGATNKGKQGQFQTVRTVTPTGNIKASAQQNFSRMKPSSPLPHQEPSNASRQISSSSKSARYYAGQSPKAVGESPFKPEEADLGGVNRLKHDPDSGWIADENDGQGILKNKMSPETEGSALVEDIISNPVKEVGSKSIYDSNTDELSTTMSFPLAINNSFFNRDCSTGLVIEMAQKGDTSLFLDSILKENN